MYLQTKFIEAVVDKEFGTVNEASISIRASHFRECYPSWWPLPIFWCIILCLVHSDYCFKSQNNNDRNVILKLEKIKMWPPQKSRNTSPIMYWLLRLSIDYCSWYLNYNYNQEQDERAQCYIYDFETHELSGHETDTQKDGWLQRHLSHVSPPYVIFLELHMAL